MIDLLTVLLYLTRPVPGVITQGPSRTHRAIDFVCSVGDPVVAAHSGTLTKTNTRDLGIVARVSGDEFVSHYAHLSAVENKTSVVGGEKLGECGNTGLLTTGPHLHFEVENI